MLKDFYCPDCGGTDLTAEGYCTFDAVKQEFVLDSVCDEYEFCEDCSEHVHGEWRELADVKTLAKLAIHKESTR